MAVIPPLTRTENLLTPAESSTLTLFFHSQKFHILQATTGLRQLEDWASNMTGMQLTTFPKREHRLNALQLFTIAEKSVAPVLHAEDSVYFDKKPAYRRIGICTELLPFRVSNEDPWSSERALSRRIGPLLEIINIFLNRIEAIQSTSYYTSC
jgi:hypothetical protein